MFPLLYPEVFGKFNMTPPKGVLFYGPPGTGKTLMARALACECSQDNRKVAFFMRKGADCLSKWIGESERQLRLLFDRLTKCDPASFSLTRLMVWRRCEALARTKSTPVS